MASSDTPTGIIEHLTTESYSIAELVCAHNAASALLGRFSVAQATPNAQNPAETQADTYVKIFKKILEGMRT